MEPCDQFAQAIIRDDVDRAMDLVSKGLVDKDGRDLGMRPLLFNAVSEGALKITRALLELGADVKASTIHWSNGKIAHVAVMNSLEMLALVHEFGADLEARNAMGHTPLRVAAAGNNSDKFAPIANYLISNGASVKAQDHQGVTLLDRLVAKQDRDTHEKAAHLISLGALVTKTTVERSHTLFRHRYRDSLAVHEEQQRLKDLTDNIIVVEKRTCARPSL